MNSRAHPTWSNEEIEAVRLLFPCGAWADILRAVPNRSRVSINQYARNTLGLRRGVNRKVSWSEEEMAILRRLYRTSDPCDLENALPGRTFFSIMRKGCELGIRRLTIGTRKNTRHVRPFIEQLRVERERRKLTRPQLCRKLGYHRNNLLGWELGKTNPDIRVLCDWAQALGFEVRLQQIMTRQIIDETVIPWPDRNRLMAGRA